MPQPRQSRLQRRLIRHHAPLFLASSASVAALYFTRPYPDVLSRASFATAYPALLLLVATLLIGPWKILRKSRVPISSDLRRDIGIWAGILAELHTIVGQNVHLRGRPWLYYVYEQRSHHTIPVRHDLFGLANYTGMLSFFVVCALLATSNDYFLRRLGAPKWKQLQRWNYAAFGLLAIHALAYQTIEKQQRAFVMVVVTGTTITLGLQLLGFWRKRKLSQPRRQSD